MLRAGAGRVLGPAQMHSLGLGGAGAVGAAASGGDGGSRERRTPQSRPGRTRRCWRGAVDKPLLKDQPDPKRKDSGTAKHTQLPHW